MIKYRLCGRVDNSEILKYYGENRIDCFAHVSSAEGLPVSIMEAESAGIPIVATNVGGTAEMIDGNGVLLPADPSADEIASAIISCILASDDKKRSMGERSGSIWNEKFNARENAKKFVDHIRERYEGRIRHIIFITEGYPFCYFEKSFLESELKELSRRFDVTVVARNSGYDEELYDKQFDTSIKAVSYYDKRSRADLLIYGPIFFLDKMTRSERKDIFFSGKRRTVRYWESIKYYTKAKKFYKWFSKQDLFSKYEQDNTLIYSYWNTEPILGICLNRQKHKGVSVISRVHGYDHQDEQWPKSERKPFMKTVDSLIDEIVFISKTGKEYHIKRNGLIDSTKYTVSYIGSNGANSLSAKEEGPLRIVSCASLLPIKRVDLLIDSLKRVSDLILEKDIEWVHFGDGPLREKIETYAAEKLGNG